MMIKGYFLQSSTIIDFHWVRLTISRFPVEKVKSSNRNLRKSIRPHSLLCLIHYYTHVYNIMTIRRLY